MKIAWLQDMDIFANTGGAQMTDRLHFIEGLRQGHDIELVLPNQLNRSTIRNADLTVISNCRTFHPEILKAVTEEIITPYVVFHHDYWFCKWRGFYPGEGCGKCEWHPLGLEFWEHLYRGAKLNIFLSPLHRIAHTATFKDEVDGWTTAVCPSPVNTGLFKPQPGIERIPNSVVYVGVFTKYKGLYNILKFVETSPELQYHFIGGGDPDIITAIQQAGHSLAQGVPNQDLPSVYSQFEYFIHLPANPMPMERTVIEAYLCGCKLIVNENVGAVSHPWWTDREEVRSHIANSSKQFWQLIGNKTR